MNISEYTSYFHDGSLLDIQYVNNELLLSLESAEVWVEELTEAIALSEHKTLQGILHCGRIQAVCIDGTTFKEQLTMITDSANILRFSVANNQVRLFVEWLNFMNGPVHSNNYSEIVIEAEHIYWKNRPDRVTP